MICQRCLQRASSALGSRKIPQIPISIPLRPRSGNPAVRPFSSTITRQSSSPAPEPPTPSTSEAPVFSTPLSNVSSKEAPVLSACPEGTILTGLNYFKNGTDPVALADSAYPEWLWDCLEVQKKADEEEDADAGDEFSKSRKQRRLAAKKQRAREARLIAEGNLEALAPKIPLHHQSINLPSNEEHTAQGAILAVEARSSLRKAMRKEKKKQIKESNYLKSM